MKRLLLGIFIFCTLEIYGQQEPFFDTLYHYRAKLERSHSDIIMKIRNRTDTTIYLVGVADGAPINLSKWEISPQNGAMVFLRKNKVIGCAFDIKTELYQGKTTIVWSFVENEEYIFANPCTVINYRADFNILDGLLIYSKKLKKAFWIGFYTIIPYNPAPLPEDRFVAVTSIHEIDNKFRTTRVFRFVDGVCIGMSDFIKQDDEFFDNIRIYNNGGIRINNFSFEDLPILRAKIEGQKSLFVGKCKLKDIPYCFYFRHLYDLGN